MDLNNLIREIIILAPPFLFAVTFHEFSHGYVAYRLGDPTAKQAGRLTLNPVKHLDPLGVIAFFIMKIGWAKPVPVNPVYFSNPRQGMLLTALAGPASNLVLAVASAVVLKLLAAASFLPLAFLKPAVMMLGASVWINILLAVFNLIPIPPLDGSRIMAGVLSPEQARAYMRLEPFGFIILLGLFYTGIIPKLTWPIIMYANRLLLG